MTNDELIAYYNEQFEFATVNEILDLIATLNVQTKIGGATFTISPRKYQIGAIKRLLAYGCRREPNDGVASLKTDKEKVDTIALKLGEWESGKFTETRLRVAGLTLEQEIKCKIVLKALGEDRKKYDEMDKEKRSNALLALYDANVADVPELHDEFVRLMDEATRVKPTISLKVKA